jgi:hypothetical protein
MPLETAYVFHGRGAFSLKSSLWFGAFHRVGHSGSGFMVASNSAAVSRSLQCLSIHPGSQRHAVCRLMLACFGKGIPLVASSLCQEHCIRDAAHKISKTWVGVRPLEGCTWRDVHLYSAEKYTGDNGELCYLCRCVEMEACLRHRNAGNRSTIYYIVADYQRYRSRK